MLLNSATRYGWVSILLHWLMALAFIALYFLGTYMVDLDYYDSWYHRAPEIHKSVGILLTLGMIFRFFWNHLQTRPQALSDNRRAEFAGRLVHWSFYLIVVALFFTGYLIATAEGKGIEVFDWFSVPALLTTQSDNSDLSGDLHELIANTFMLLVVVHVLASLYHHHIVKDITLKRMLGINTTNKET